MERSNDDKAAEQREARMRTLRNDVKVRANQYGLKIDKEDADVFAMNDFLLRHPPIKPPAAAR